MASPCGLDAATVEAGGIAERLEQMVDLLCQEEEERDHRDPGTMVGEGRLRLRVMISIILHLAHYIIDTLSMIPLCWIPFILLAPQYFLLPTH